MNTIRAAMNVVQPADQSKQEIEEASSLPTDLEPDMIESFGLEGIPLEVILQKGCYDTDFTGGCG